MKQKKVVINLSTLTTWIYIFTIKTELGNAVEKDLVVN